MRPYHSAIVLACLLAVLFPSPGPAAAAEPEPRVFLLGIWPNQLRYYDEATESFIGETRLRYGAVTSYWPAPHTPDWTRIYYITDRMEAVEVVDPRRREVVDELRLSTPEHRVRVHDVAPSADGKTLYLRGSRVALGADRMEAEESQFFVYDLGTHALKETFRVPEEVPLNFFNPLQVAPNGNLLALSDDIYELAPSDRHILRRFGLPEPRGGGYGPIQLVALRELEGDSTTLIGLYATTDPVLKKSVLGVIRVELEPEPPHVETFELGPDIEADTFALSPDGKFGFGGPRDLVKIDMAAKTVVGLKKGFERGRTNNTLIVSADGKKLYVAGVGNQLYVVDTETLERAGSVPLGGDTMTVPIVLPATVGSVAAARVGR